MENRNVGDAAAGPQVSERALHPYDLTSTVVSACRFDQRFSYSLYIPKHFAAESSNDFRLLVAVHATNRAREGLLQGFREFADRNNFIVLVPLFPARIVDADDMDNYKYLLYRDIRFDIVLQHMANEVTERYGIADRQFNMFGFSGGAHFVHRYLLLYPEQVRAAVIAAPGSITRINDDESWWVGTADTEEKFGRRVDPQGLRDIDILLVVGADDTRTNGIVHKPGSPHWMKGANCAGGNRIERIRSLRQNLVANGIPAALSILPGTGHEEGPLVQCAVKFFEQHA